jgi:2-C-methyl-D-erythritol 4-phosphate cytidylyltransferase
MGGGLPKQFTSLGGVPILVHTLRAFERSDRVVTVVLVVPEADREYCRKDIVSRYGLTKVVAIVAGGEQRQDSVRRGLAAVEEGIELVLVHDAVRPFLTPAMIDRVIERAAECGAAVTAIPLPDTVKQAGEDGRIERTVDRAKLWLAQTPQAFKRLLLEEAHRKAEAEGFPATDDAQLVERLGHRVAIVEGSGENIKITRPEDLAIGEAILATRRTSLPIP